MDLLSTTDENKSHYVYIEDLNRFMCMGQIIKEETLLQILFTMF